MSLISSHGGEKKECMSLISSRSGEKEREPDKFAGLVECLFLKYFFLHEPDKLVRWQKRMLELYKFASWFVYCATDSCIHSSAVCSKLTEFLAVI